MADPLVQVIPDDGSEPIELRVSDLEISVASHDAARVEATMFMHSLDITDEDGRRALAKPEGRPVVFPDLEVYDPDFEESHTVACVGWRYTADRRRRRFTNPLTFRRVQEPSG